MDIELAILPRWNCPEIIGFPWLLNSVDFGLFRSETQGKHMDTPWILGAGETAVQTAARGGEPAQTQSNPAPRRFSAWSAPKFLGLAWGPAGLTSTQTHGNRKFCIRFPESLYPYILRWASGRIPAESAGIYPLRDTRGNHRVRPSK